MSGPAETAALIGAIATAAKTIPDALAKLDHWINGGGPVPIDVLPQLPDLTRNDLELAALKQRAAQADKP